MTFRAFTLLLMVFVLMGCAAGGATTLYTPDYAGRRQPVRTVAVMPLQLNLVQIQAGGNAELIDEWRAEAGDLMRDELEAALKARGLHPVLADQDYLRQFHHPLWRKYRALFETVTAAALTYGFDLTAFPTKVENFDYTLGTGTAELAALFDADALLFVYGTDNTSTAGRKWVAAANLGLVDYGYDSLVMALVDAESGDYLWLKRTPPYENMNLRDAQFVNRTVTWMFEDFSGPAE